MTAQALPRPWDGWVNSVLPSALPSALPGQLAGAGNPHSIYGSALSPPVALAVLAGYAVVPLILAAVVIQRRDA